MAKKSKTSESKRASVLAAMRRARLEFVRTESETRPVRSPKTVKQMRLNTVYSAADKTD